MLGSCERNKDALRLLVCNSPSSSSTTKGSMVLLTLPLFVRQNVTGGSGLASQHVKKGQDPKRNANARRMKGSDPTHILKRANQRVELR
jgi:hypothetical protein